MMDQTGVARSLEQIASYLEFKEENPFCVRALALATLPRFGGHITKKFLKGLAFLPQAGQW
jgi:hypothetical protein